MEDIVEPITHVSTVRVTSRVFLSSDLISENLSFLTVEMGGLGSYVEILHGVVMR